MKTRRLTTILTSAYVSAMLASSVAPIRSDATLAATIDPMAAQKALQSAVSSLDAAGWLAASTTGAPVTTQPTPKSTPANNPPPKPIPLTTAEWMARLIKFTHASPTVGVINPKLCAVLELCDGTKDMPLMIVKSDATDRALYFALPRDANSKDIVILTLTPDVDTAYLTDKTGKLRAAAVSDRTGVRLIINEKAAKQYKAEIEILAKEAEGLPPSATPAPGNS
jgi:hypothetical protein